METQTKEILFPFTISQWCVFLPEGKLNTATILQTMSPQVVRRYLVLRAFKSSHHLSQVNPNCRGTAIKTGLHGSGLKQENHQMLLCCRSAIATAQASKAISTHLPAHLRRRAGLGLLRNFPSSCQVLYSNSLK